MATVYNTEGVKFVLSPINARELVARNAGFTYENPKANNAVSAEVVADDTPVLDTGTDSPEEVTLDELAKLVVSDTAGAVDFLTGKTIAVLKDLSLSRYNTPVPTGLNKEQIIQFILGLETKAMEA